MVVDILISYHKNVSTLLNMLIFWPEKCFKWAPHHETLHSADRFKFVQMITYFLMVLNMLISCHIIFLNDPS